MIRSGHLWPEYTGVNCRARCVLGAPRAPYAIRAFLIEQPDAFSYVRVMSGANHVLAEAWNDDGQLERRGAFGVVPISQYWAKDRRWRDFGAIMVHGNAWNLELEVDCTRKLETDARVYALAFAQTRNWDGILHIGLDHGHPVPSTPVRELELPTSIEERWQLDS